MHQLLSLLGGVFFLNVAEQVAQDAIAAVAEIREQIKQRIQFRKPSQEDAPNIVLLPLGANGRAAGLDA